MTISSKKWILVTITDSISPANMPYNEFVLYRLKHEPAEKQFFIVLFDAENRSNIEFPNELSIYPCGKQISLLKNALKEIDTICQQEDAIPIFHIHEGKSVLFFNLVSKGKYRRQTIYTIHSTFSNYPLHNKVLATVASFLAKKVICVS